MDTHRRYNSLLINGLNMKRDGNFIALITVLLLKTKGFYENL